MIAKSHKVVPKSVYVQARLRKNQLVISLLTLFRLGFFEQSLTGGGLLEPPLLSQQPLGLELWNFQIRFNVIKLGHTHILVTSDAIVTSQWRHFAFYWNVDFIHKMCQKVRKLLFFHSIRTIKCKFILNVVKKCSTDKNFNKFPNLGVRHLGSAILDFRKFTFLA